MPPVTAPLRHDALVTAVRRAAMILPLGHVEALAQVVELQAGPGLYANRAMTSAVPQDAFRQVAVTVAEAWEKTYDAMARAPDGRALAIALRVAGEVARAARAEETVEIVWTGPSSLEVPVRLTKEVIVQLARVSKSVLWLTSFSAYRVPLVLQTLAETAARGVDVRLVLETRDDSLGALTHDAAAAFKGIEDRVAMFAWPLDRRPRTEGIRASMHAKSVVADHSAAFVTSANLTGTALDTNMELGLLVRGGPTPRKLALHFQALVEQGVLRRVGHSA
jgi:cardiolipin synthase A/B